MITRPIMANGRHDAIEARTPTHATPLTGVVIGSAISLLLWALIAALFFIIR